VRQKKAGKKSHGGSLRPEPTYIVGIGASAGGLEAFYEFFRNMPPDTGMAFVLVSHLDPNQKDFLPELIARSTKMPVIQITDRMPARPDTVHVIPPNTDLSLLHGVFSLLEPTLVRGLRMPIDHFFRELAKDQKERSIAIVLSGMGTDGSLGIKDIKEQMGLVMVQEPGTAKFPSMPSNAVESGLADFVLPIKDIPEKLVDFASRQSVMPRKVLAIPQKSLSAVQKIFILLRSRTGHDFSQYKKNSILRRIERRIEIHQLAGIADYVRYLQANPQEIDILFKELLISVTNFFREPDAWVALKETALPELIKLRRAGDILRIWVVGCSTGEEAYSVAIILRELQEAGKLKDGMKIQIFATDISEDALDTARHGLYLQNITADISPERLARWFVKEGDWYRVKKELRDLIVFAPQNIIQDPPFTRLDLISCRNLFIYFTPELQRKIIPLFQYAILPGGLLFLGSSETIGETPAGFKPLDAKSKIFRRRELPLQDRITIQFPSSPTPFRTQPKKISDKGKEATIPGLAQSILLDHYTPPAALITEEGDILYFHGRTGRYLEHTAGKANLNIYAMASEGLRYELGNAIKKAHNEGIEVIAKNLEVRTGDKTSTINLIVRPLRKPEEMRDYLLVIFEEVLQAHPAVQKKSRKKANTPGQETPRNELEEELRLTRARLQSTMDEIEAHQEEQKSLGEEFQSTNEELQSTNEELTTSKEELQSLNEELMTVNAELEMKVNELSESHDDMENLLNSTDIAMVFLDIHLNVRRFTKPMTKLFSLLPNDIGRPITDIVPNLRYNRIGDDVRDVIATLARKEMQVETKDNRWYVMRILPYRTGENVIDGAVVFFSDITEIKSLERSYKASQKFAENILDTLREPFVVLNADLRVAMASASFYKIFQEKQKTTEGQTIWSLGNGQWDIPELRRLLEEIIPRDTAFEDFRVEHIFPVIGHRVMHLNARRIASADKNEKLILLAMESD
jgi:two-component system CheB/CheR fusion protein